MNRAFSLLFSLLFSFSFSFSFPVQAGVGGLHGPTCPTEADGAYMLPPPPLTVRNAKGADVPLPLSNTVGIIRLRDGAFITASTELNPPWVCYQYWLSQGHTPLPYAP